MVGEIAGVEKAAAAAALEQAEALWLAAHGEYESAAAE
jgi:hypothetical protein